MKEVNGARVFLNYKDLYSCNLYFWNRSILPVLNQCRYVCRACDARICRQHGGLLDPRLMFDGFQELPEWSRSYVHFNIAHADSHGYVQKRQKEHELFREFVTVCFSISRLIISIQWAEAQQGMRRQKLLDALGHPMQRLTRYSLLLKAVLRNTVNSDERAALQVGLSSSR